MYEKYALFDSKKLLSEHFGMNCEENFEKFNASPSDILPIIVGEEKNWIKFRWGSFSKWANNKMQSESALYKRAESIVSFAQQSQNPYQHQVCKNTCIIPMNGIFMNDTSKKGRNLPYFIHSKKHPIFGVCGVWEAYEDLEGNTIQTFLMLTIKTKSTLKVYSESMPLILSPKHANQWLKGDYALNKSTIENYNEQDLQLAMFPVSSLVYNQSENTADIILPVENVGNNQEDYNLFS